MYGIKLKHNEHPQILSGSKFSPVLKTHLHKTAAKSGSQYKHLKKNLIKHARPMNHSTVLGLPWVNVLLCWILCSCSAEHEPTCVSEFWTRTTYERLISNRYDPAVQLLVVPPEWHLFQYCVNYSSSLMFVEKRHFLEMISVKSY